jgi:CRISPR/Cas system-associated exonuclease Cas4 (RecB family)
MILPTDFSFSQASLQDYVDCRRRFQLRYLLRLAWPAIEAEPALEHERLLRSGAALHRIIQQHILNVPEARLTHSVIDEDLKRWWHNYLQNPPSDLPTIRFPEIILSAPITDFRLVAKYDLLAIEPGERAVIVDWKTSLRRPSHRWMADRIQTKVYRYLLVRAGTHLNDGDQLLPSLVEMIYWFANYPEEPERLQYNEAKFNADDAFLTALIEEIQDLGEDEFILTDQEFKCLYCRYRSLCLRGVGAGEIDKMTEELETREDLGNYLDFDQISEVEF